jgi:type VI secretion system protein ImpC
MSEVEIDYLTQIVETLGGTEGDAARSMEIVAVDDLLLADSMLDALSEDYVSMNIVALLLVMANNNNIKNYNKSYVQEAIAKIDELINTQVNIILNDENFRKIENSWLQLDEIAKHDYSNVKIAILDATKEDLQNDLERNIFDISSSEIFKKVYVSEYDQYGGEPYGLLSSLYEFSNTSDDIKWLTAIGMIAEASHAPFVAALDTDFFGVSSPDEIMHIKDFESLLEHPRYRAWNELRNTDQATYLGLTYGKFILRAPYHPVNNPVGDQTMKSFTEITYGDEQPTYQWGKGSVLFLKNAIRSYGETGWLSYVRGPSNGGLIRSLVAPYVEQDGMMEQRPPLDITLPDSMELSLSKVGILPLIHEKGTSNACFFSSGSIKKVEVYTDYLASANSAMVANLSYTMCISRIAQYIKCVLRDRIGSVVSKEDICAQINSWINQYVTTVTQPSPVEMCKYPFRMAEVSIANIPGRVGWYKCSISILPHIQFEGMETIMKIDANLEPALFLANE